MDKIKSFSVCDMENGGFWCDFGWGGAGRGLVLRVLNSRSIGRLPAFGARPPFSRLGFSFPIAQPARQRAPAQLRDWEVQFPLP